MAAVARSSRPRGRPKGPSKVPRRIWGGVTASPSNQVALQESGKGDHPASPCLLQCLPGEASSWLMCACDMQTCRIMQTKMGLARKVCASQLISVHHTLLLSYTGAHRAAICVASVEPPLPGSNSGTQAAKVLCITAPSNSTVPQKLYTRETLTHCFSQCK